MQIVKGTTPLPKKGTAIIGRTTDATGLTLGAGGAFPLFESTITSDSPNVTIVSTTQIKLAAGRKYRIAAFIGSSLSGANSVDPRWYNVTAAAYIGVRGAMPAASYSGNFGSTMIPEMLLAPTVDTTLELRVQLITAGTVSSLVEGSHAYIEEVNANVESQGSVGIVEYGSNANGEYIKYSNGIMEQWAYGKQSDNNSSATWRPYTVTFPVPFASTNYAVTASVELEVNTSYSHVVYTSKKSPTVSGVVIQSMEINGTATTGYGYISWRAMGRWK